MEAIPEEQPQIPQMTQIVTDALAKESVPIGAICGICGWFSLPVCYLELTLTGYLFKQYAWG